ncbi:glycosyltransferase [Tenacibaculum sp. M341]|uniref:glycosyltransferase n=1 Tax=Tenacibaculum sp. M341 TaxID=2530339 RepID=UPI001FB1E420
MNSLKDKGHRVTVLCFHPFYPEWKTKVSNDTLDGVTIIRGGKSIFYPKIAILRRIVLELSFLFFVLRKIAKHQKNKDIILPVFPPSFAFFGILFFLNKKIRKVGMVHDLQEIYSSNKKGILNKIISFFINKIENKCYSSCDKLIFLSEEMKEQARSLYDLEKTTIEVQYPFITITDKISNDLGNVLNPENINIVYSGALGEKQNPEELYDFFKYALDTIDIDNIFFHIFSQGADFQKLKEKNSNRKIKFHNLVKKENLEELYKRSDIQIIPQLPNTSKGSLPSKLPNLLISGCKILVITDKNSEIEKLFKNNNLEKAIHSWNQDTILASLKSLITLKTDKNHQSTIAKKLFTIDQMVEKIINCTLN